MNVTKHTLASSGTVARKVALNRLASGASLITVCRMTAVLELKKMTRAEKLQAMEFLWEELSQDEDSLESPAWHEQALRETEARVAAGITKFIPWVEAEEMIDRKIAEYHERAYQQ